MTKTNSLRQKEMKEQPDKQLASGMLGLGIVMTILAVVFLILWVVEPVFFAAFVVPLIVIILPTTGIAIMAFVMYARYK